jgi:hypothetical protein
MEFELELWVVGSVLGRVPATLAVASSSGRRRK